MHITLYEGVIKKGTQLIIAHYFMQRKLKEPPVLYASTSCLNTQIETVAV